MDDKQILDILINTREDIGTIKSDIKTLCEKVSGMGDRLQEIEQKPAKRVDGAITTIIATVVASIVSSVIAVFTKN